MERTARIVPILLLASLFPSAEHRVSAQPSDTTPPVCTLSSILPGPPRELRIVIQDPDSGLASIAVTRSVNADMALPPYAFGIKGPLPITATRIDPSKSMDIALTAQDVAGNSGSCEFSDSGATIPTLDARALAALALGLAAAALRKLEAI